MNWIIKLGSLQYCYRVCVRCTPWAMGLSIILWIVGLLDALWWVPSDYQQGNIYRILFLHVPAATFSLLVYLWMAVLSVIYFIWKINIADFLAKISAPLGALFTVLALVSGALWGKTTWGTYWIWDARLTSELLLLFLYFAIMGLRQGIPDSKIAAKSSALLTWVGLVNIPIIHYSVFWWRTLHQGPTFLKLGTPAMPFVMWQALIVMFLAYLFYFIWLLGVQLQTELLGKIPRLAQKRY